MEKVSPSHARFGDFELDIGLGRLCRDGHSVQLGEKPLRVLVTLIEQSGQLVTRENLQQKLWPNDTIVDFEHGINTAIKVLRRALGESAEAPKYIETIPRRGYRLLLPVAWITPAKDSEEAGPLPHPFVISPSFQSGVGGLTGLRVSHYRVLEVIGGGGMGVVYRGEDLPLGRSVALKFLSEELTGNSEALERFRLEARAVSMLDHPNICPIYEFGEHEDKPFFVMPLLQGRILRDRLLDAANRNQPIPLKELLEIGLEVLSGMQAAHEKGIIHRDIKPANIFLTEYGQAKIMDFGLAKLATSISSSSPALAEINMPFPVRDLRLTNPGTALGTLAYMSPEQARSEELDARTDLFSFGIVLYEMATGGPAFRSEDPALVLKAILEENPAPATTLNPALPMELDRILIKALEKDRNVRYQSAAEMRGDLQQLKREIEVPGAREVSVAHIWPGVHWRWQLAASVAIIVIVAAAVFTYVGYVRSREPTIDSIAVMPFAAKGAGSSGGELGDGITAGLIDSLSQVPNLRVMSRTSVAHYKGHEIDPQKVGQELNVRAVLTGTLTPRDSGFTLDTELVNTTDGSHIWGQQYDTKPGEILTIEEELARTLSDRLRPRFSSEAKGSLARSGTSNPEAYSFYVKGLYAIDGFDPQHTKEALDYFRQAINLDPAYAQAYGGLGDAYATLAHLRSIPFRDGLQKAKAAAHRALELNPNLAEGHCALGLAAHISWEWEEAERESRRCVHLNPNLFFAHETYALILADRGKMAQAVAEQKIAMKLDPVSYMANNFLGNVYYYSRDYDRCIEQRLKLIDLEPDRLWQHDSLADCYARKGEYDKAAPEYEKELKMEGKANEAEVLRRAYAEGGFRSLLMAQLQMWSDPGRTDDYAPTYVAQNYSLLGDRENAFLWLDRAYADNERMGANNGSLIVALIEPAFDNIRSDPRFTAFLRRMGFQE